MYLHYLGYVSFKFDKTHFKFHNDSLKVLNKAVTKGTFSKKFMGILDKYH